MAFAVIGWYKELKQPLSGYSTAALNCNNNPIELVAECYEENSKT